MGDGLARNRPPRGGLGEASPALAAAIGSPVPGSAVRLDLEALGAREVAAPAVETERPSIAPRYVLKPDYHSSHSVVLRWLTELRRGRLLDVGAADGILSRLLTERGWAVTAIEGDPDLARAGAPHCERMIVADLNRGLPDLGEPFDAIVCADVLEHLVDPPSVLRALRARLAPGGSVLISVPNVAHLYVRLLLLAGRFDYIDRGILDRTHLRFFTERSLRELVAEAGLEVARFTATPAPLYQILPERMHKPWVALTHDLNAAIAQRFPRLLGYQFIVLARLPSGADAAGRA